MGWRVVLFIGLFLLLTSGSSAQVIFNEIMYDFPGTDSKHEWVEIYNSGSDSVNLTNWKVKEGGSNHGFTLIEESLILGANSFALIADDASTFWLDYPGFNSTLLDSSFPSGFSSNGEELILLNSLSQVQDNLTYNASLGAAGNGKTICFFNGTWQECLATPGKENQINLTLPLNETNPANSSNSTNTSIFPNIVLLPYLTGTLYVETDYGNLFKLVIQNKENCSNKDMITVNYTITGTNYSKANIFTKEVGCSSYSATGEVSPPFPGEYTFCGQIVNSTLSETNFTDNQICFNLTAIDTAQLDCDVDININLREDLIYQQGQSLSYSFSLNNDTFPFIIEYWIEDLFGRLVKSQYNTTNTYSKTWKADISEEDRILYLKARLYPNCQDHNFSNNYVQKMFIVTNAGMLQQLNNTNTTNNTSYANTSYILINKVTPSELDWGEALRAEVEIHKGNTNKYSISAWVEVDDQEVSEVTKINLYSKDVTYKLALPLLLDSRCEEEAQDAILVLEGLDQRTEQKISIAKSSSDCSAEEDPSNSFTVSDDEESLTPPPYSTEEDVSYELFDLPTRISPGQILTFKVKFKGDEWDHFFQTYSYIYRGSRCYSCEAETKEREDDLQEFLLGFGEEKIIEVSLPLDGEMKSGEYKLKVKVHKDGQITAKSVDANILVGTGDEEKGMGVTLTTLSNSRDIKEIPSLNTQRTILNQSYFLVYESSNEKAKRLIPYLLALVFGLLCVVLIKYKV